MKVTRSITETAKLNSAFDKINSANSEELDEIVTIIEQYGRKVQISKKKVSQKISHTTRKRQLVSVH